MPPTALAQLWLWQESRARCPAGQSQDVASASGRPGQSQDPCPEPGESHGSVLCDRHMESTRAGRGNAAPLGARPSCPVPAGSGLHKRAFGDGLRQEGKKKKAGENSLL